MTAPTLGSARRIAWTAGGAFAAFYIFYTAAPLIFEGTTPDAGVRVAVVMLVVVAVQPLVLVAGRWVRSRRTGALTALTGMGLGMAVMPFAGHWPGMMLLAVGFGVFVVTSTAWVKEAAPAAELGRALGVYGFGAAIGGAIGAPLGLFLADRFGLPGIAIAGTTVALAALIPNGRDRSAPASCPDRSQVEGAESATGSGDTSAGGYAVTAFGLLGHLLAVSIYASVLSGLTGSTQGHGAWLVVWTAFAIQTALAAGRWVGGAIDGRWSPARTGLSSLALLVVGAIGFTWSTTPLLVLASGIVVGLASGACQTAALTALMRRARSTAGTNRASAAWNICFDIGLSFGALAAAQTARR